MIWFTSDTHFGHAPVIKFCNRPFKDLEEMHETIIKNWNISVKPYDTIYVVGDLALCRYRDFYPIAQRLQGRKILIQGNHDKYSLSQYEKLGFQVFQEIKLKLFGQSVRISHYPYALPWYRRPFAFASELRFMDRRPPKVPGEFLIHGHSHTKYREAGNRIHVGCDAWDFRPVSLWEIESIIGKKLEERK